jgi:aryl-alcohol dehydrogenase-like predicted oxidoreductase
VPIVTVQNRYNLSDRHSEDVLSYCTRNEIGFIPWYPLATGELASKAGPLAAIAQRHHAAPAQIALAWLLRHSKIMLPIPGTSSIAHLEENTRGAAIELSDEDVRALDAVGPR